MSSVFDQLGGLTQIKRLADQFYTIMENDPQVAELRALHAKKLISARKKLSRFLAEWLGGPKLFGTQYVNAQWLELNHRRLSLDDNLSSQWLYCMNQAMTNLQLDTDLQAQLDKRFRAMIKAMQIQREKDE